MEKKYEIDDRSMTFDEPEQDIHKEIFNNVLNFLESSPKRFEEEV